MSKFFTDYGLLSLGSVRITDLINCIHSRHSHYSHIRIDIYFSNAALPELISAIS
jgi:hypothetical protein